MDQVIKEENIEELWRAVCHESKEALFQDRRLSNSPEALKNMRRLCGNCACSFGRFTPHQNLSLLLRFDPTKNHLATDYNVGLSILTNYRLFAHQNHCMKALENIVRSALSAPKSDERNAFLKLVWNHFGFQKFQIILIEEFIFNETQFLEEHLFDLFLESLAESGQKNIWESHKYQPLVFWCSKSAKLYALVTSVLNSLFIRTCEQSSCSESVTNIVQTFVHSVKLKCTESKTDFVLLYPREYHTLVMFLNIHPEMFSRGPENQLSVTLETVVDLIKKNMGLRPIQTFSILTHFPEWAPFLS